MVNIQYRHRQYCEYMLVFRGLTPRTIRGYKEIFNYFIRFEPVSQVSHVTQDMIEEWLLHGKLERNWCAKTIRNRLIALRAFFNWCCEREYITVNPTSKIPKPKLPKSLPKSLSLHQAEKLLEWTSYMPYYFKFERNRAIAIIAMFLFTGIRIGELYTLKLIDVNIQDKVLVIISGKGQKDRKIPLNERLIEYLESYLKDRKEKKYNCPYFFVAFRRDAKMCENVVKRLVVRLRDSSGIYFYPHILRHTFATLMLEGGCNLYSLSRMMGHSDIKTTTIYLGTTTAHLHNEMNKHPLY